MTIVQTADLGHVARPKTENHQIYCGLDSAVALEVHQGQAKDPRREDAERIYDFERAMQGPYLEVMLRGWRVDEINRRRAVEILRARQENFQRILDRLADAAWSKPLNARSNDQLKELFYERMLLPVQYSHTKGVKRETVNRQALEKLEDYAYARPFVRCILGIRDCAKQAEVFESEVDADGRLRTSYNIAGTETGRPSSSISALGTGGPVQNIAPNLRFAFVADPGWKLVQIDQAQAEGRDLGFFCGCLFDDWSYLDAAESGDMHTFGARLVWPELAWTGDPLRDREVAEQVYYRDFSHRHMMKRAGYLTNYKGTAFTAARILKVPVEVMHNFQQRYVLGGPRTVAAFPCILRFWQWVAQELQTVGQLTNPFGQTRQFFGRSSDEATLREAIATLPQGTTANRMNLGMWRIWKKMPQVQLLHNGYDSVTLQARDDADFDRNVAEAVEHCIVPLQSSGGRKFVVPCDAKVGWNWGEQVTQADVEKAKARGQKPPRLNLDGLVKWKPGQDKRQRLTGLQRRM